MTDRWWDKLSAHFRISNGFPLPDVMRGQAERELLRLCPGTLDDAIDRIVEDAALSQSLVDSLGMGLTWFNRESQGILGLVEVYRRQLISTGRTTFWVWSAGCSMGQEPYSIAIALLEAGARPIILATDLNREHIRIAETGRYRPGKLDMIAPHLLEKYFHRSKRGMREVTQELRHCVTFQHHNFATNQRPPAGWSNFDAVVCRNALIYYDTAEGSRIAENLCNALRPRGVLLVGAVERPLLHALRLGPISPGGIATYLGYDSSKEASEESPKKEKAKPRPKVVPSTPAGTGVTPIVKEKWKPRIQGSTDELSLDALLHEADQLLRKRDSIGACIELLNQTLIRFPLSSGAHLLLGLSLKRAGRSEEALTPLRAARFLDSKGWLAVYHLALCLESANHHTEAQAAFRDALALLRSGSPGSSTEIPGVGDLRVLASTVAEHCTQRLSFEGSDRR